MKPKAVLQELEELFSGRWTPGDLIMFQSRHKLTIMAHSSDALKELAQLSSNAAYIDARSLERSYRAQIEKAFSAESTIAKNVSVFDYAFNLLKEELKDDERNELKQLIEQYRTKEISKTKPINRFRKLIKTHQPEGLVNQSYFEAETKKKAA